jgi:iron complex outermembrane recepter protein
MKISHSSMVFAAALVLAMGCIDAEAESEAASDATPSSASQSGSTTELQEVIVTARRREENLYDIPVSVTAVSAATIEAHGINTISDTFGEVPSLFWTTQGAPMTDASTSFLVIRGVGATYVSDPSVGIFVDGVYQPTIDFGEQILGVDRMEVLRGPQGTLFGRNTEGGAVNFVTRRPSQDWEASISGQIDQFNTYNVTGYVSGPITDSLAANISVFGGSTDGYIHNDYDGRALGSTAGKLRAGLLWTGDHGAEIYATGFYEKQVNGNSGLGVLQGCNCYDVNIDIDRPNPMETYGASISATLPLDGVRLKSLTGYSFGSTDTIQDVDGTSTFKGNYSEVTQQQRFTSEELRLESDTHGALQWTLGAYWEQSVRSQTVNRQFPDFAGYDPLQNGVVIFATGDIDTTSYAAFLDTTYKFSEHWDVDLGARYSTERSTRAGGGFLDVPALGGIISSVTSDGASSDDSAFTPKVAINFHPAANSSIYASYATGFKAGGYSLFPGLNDLSSSFKSETSHAFELGAKGLMMNGRLSLSGDLFYTRILGQQVEVTVIIDGLPRSVFDNAGRSHTEGFEYEGRYAISDNWHVGLTGSYTEAKYDQFINSNGTNLAGTPFPYVPAWLLSGSVEYRHPVSDGRTFVTELKGRFVDTQQSDPSVLPGADDVSVSIPKYTVLDLRAGVEGDKWSVFGFVDNVLNRYYATFAQYAQFTFGNPPYNNQIYESPGAPRLVGVRFQYRF